MLLVHSSIKFRLLLGSHLNFAEHKNIRKVHESSYELTRANGKGRKNQVECLPERKLKCFGRWSGEKSFLLVEHLMHYNIIINYEKRAREWWSHAVELGWLSEKLLGSHSELIEKVNLGINFVIIHIRWLFHQLALIFIINLRERICRQNTRVLFTRVSVLKPTNPNQLGKCKRVSTVDIIHHEPSIDWPKILAAKRDRWLIECFTNKHAFKYYRYVDIWIT